MKKYLTATIILILALSFTVPAYADTVFTAFASSEKAKEDKSSSGSGFEILDPHQIRTAIVNGADLTELGIGPPKLPNTTDLKTTQTMYKNSIMIFDPETPSKAGYVNLSVQPYWLIYNPSNKLLYISYASQIILVFNPATDKIIGFLDTRGLVTDMCLTKDFSGLYIGVMSKNRKHAVWVLDCARNKFTTGYKTPRPASAVAVSPDGKTLYYSICSRPRGTVYAVNTSDKSLKAEAQTGTSPASLCITPDGKELYVSNLNSASVSVIDTGSFKVKAVISVGIEPLKMAVSQGGEKIYLACRKSNYISVIDTKTHNVLKTIKVGAAPTDIALSPDGKKAYITNNESKTISIIDTEQDKVIQTTSPQLKSKPWGIAVK
ncbi:MAG: beta-propeller fold lactonase family protein [Armatimonadota bacterium]